MSPDAPVDRVLEKVVEAIANQQSPESNKDEKTVSCFHHFGYLSELPKTASIPEECFSEIYQFIGKSFTLEKRQREFLVQDCRLSIGEISF